MTNLKEKLKQSLILFSAINLALFGLFIGIAHGPSVAQAAGNDFVIDNKQAMQIGGWHSSDAVDTYQGIDYLVGSDYGPDANGDVIRWSPSEDQLKHEGKYKVSAWWTQYPNRTDSVDYVVHSNDKPSGKHVNVNQQINGGQWNLLGKYGEYEFVGGNNEYIEIENNRTQPNQGYVIADAIQFKLVDAYPETPTPQSQTNGVYTNDNAPLLDWNDVEDPLEDVDYNYQVRKNGPNQPVIWNYNDVNGSYIDNSQLQAGTTNDGEYYWQIKAVDESGNKSDWSDPRKITIDTKEPTATIANKCNGCEEGDEITLVTKSVDGNGSPIKNYDWTITKPDGTNITKTGQEPKFSADAPGDYTIDLTIEDMAGNINKDEKIKHVTYSVANVLPESPDMSLTRDDGIIKLSWEKVKDTRGYQIIKNGIPIQNNNDLLSPTKTSYIDYDVSNGSRYEYRVRAYDRDAGYEKEYTRSNPQWDRVPEPEVKFVTASTSAVGGRTIKGQVNGDGEVKAQEDGNKDEGKTEGELDKKEKEKPAEAADEPKTNWPMIIAIIIAATIVLGGAAYWWYGISEDEDEI